MNAAHLHLILNHIPVLGGMATLALLVLSGLKDNAVLAKLTLQFMVFVGMLTFPVYFSGEPAEEIIEHFPGVTEAYISQHERFALYSLICTEILAVIGVIGLLSFRKSQAPVMKYWKSIGVVALVNACLMLATANYGGQIRHTEIRKTDFPGLTTENSEVPKQEHEDR